MIISISIYMTSMNRIALLRHLKIIHSAVKYDVHYLTDLYIGKKKNLEMLANCMIKTVVQKYFKAADLVHK